MKARLNVFLTLAVLAGQARASFEPVSVGARAAGMSDAYAAAADDAAALYYNPAGLARVRRREVGSAYSQLLSGFDDGSRASRSFLGYVHPLSGERGALGVGYLHAGLSGLYAESAWGVSYARRARGALSWGATLKRLGRAYGADAYAGAAVDADSGASLGGADPVLAGRRSKGGAALDLGLQWELPGGAVAALALRNVNQPDLALSGTRDPAPAVTALGLSKRLSGWLVAADLSTWKFAGVQDRVLNLGAERWFPGGLGLRAGAGLGNRDYLKTSLGSSYRMESFQLDYAFAYPLRGPGRDPGTHLFSLAFRFGNEGPPATRGECRSSCVEGFRRDFGSYLKRFTRQERKVLEEAIDDVCDEHCR